MIFVQLESGTNTLQPQHIDVIAATRKIVADSKHPSRWYFLFAAICSFAVIGLLTVLSAIVHKVCMPAGSMHKMGMGMLS